ncbi:MAG TPA: hypothetical protein VHJ58_15610 [Vicinamibacterales bacterium]|jgi:hypothetical protein|nr:hypothetical protein [Vicinamibacterales bacterium]
MNKSGLVLAFLAVGIAAPATSQKVDPADKCDPASAHCVPVNAFTSTRDANGEIYLMTTNADGTVINTRDPSRITDNDVVDTFPQLSPDGKEWGSTPTGTHLGDNGEEERAPSGPRTVRESPTCAGAVFEAVTPSRST